MSAACVDAARTTYLLGGKYAPCSPPAPARAATMPSLVRAVNRGQAGAPDGVFQLDARKTACLMRLAEAGSRRVAALTEENYGRDHHPRCFSVWLAGGGVRPGIVHGTTDDYSYNITEDPVHVHDLNATIMHLLGVDHKKLTHRFQGRDYRLTDIHGHLIKKIMA